MIKYTLIFFLLLFTATTAVGQNLRSYVIGSFSAATEHTDGAVYISVGEPLNTEIEEDGTMIAQGFLQVTILGKTVATDEALDFDLTVYPNPVSQYLNIELEEVPDKSTEYIIYDQSGRLISSAPLTEIVTQVDFKTQISGIYFLQLRTSDKQSKVVKIHKQNL